MTSKAQPLKLGPFAGGLNWASDPAAIADDECADLVNFDIAPDGSLISRPAITRMPTPSASASSLYFLGNYLAPDETMYLMFSGIWTGSPRTFAFNTRTNVWVTVSTTLQPTAMVQYDTKAWFISGVGAAANGGSWDGTTFTSIAAIPRGTTAVVYKERLFVGSGHYAAKQSRVTFSNPGDFTKWTGTDFFDVNTGDGQDIVRMISYAGQIVVFKQDMTYIFAYDSTPAKGQIQLVSGTHGVDGRDCVTEADNVLYVMHNANVYTITSWTWEQINVNVPFKYVNSHVGYTRSNASMSVLGNRVVCRYYDSYYIFNYIEGVWSRWTTTLTPDIFIRFNAPVAGTSIPVYYAGNYMTDDSTTSPNYIFSFQDGFDSLKLETFTCTFLSKVYSMSLPYAFKRMMWWGVDLLAGAKVNAAVIPVSYGVPVRWSDITSRNLTWTDRGNYTWGAPLTLALDVTDSSDVKNYTNVRMFLKFLKSIRFRQVQFRLSSTVDGGNKTGPLQIFGITAFIVNKETVTKEIN